MSSRRGRRGPEAAEWDLSAAAARPAAEEVQRLPPSPAIPAAM